MGGCVITNVRIFDRGALRMIMKDGALHQAP